MKVLFSSMSKKMAVALVGVLLIVLADKFKLSVETITSLERVVLVYLGAQAVADVGKSKAQVERGPDSPKGSK